jgi:hypothetical protein
LTEIQEWTMSFFWNWDLANNTSLPFTSHI